MFRRRQINADPRGRFALLLLAAVDAVRWPFERLAWLVERRLLWPLGERMAGLALPGRTAGAGALATVAAALLVGVLWQQGSEAPRERVAAPARVAIAPPPPPPQPEKPRGRELKGTPPSFAVGKGVGVASEKGDSAGDSSKTATAPKVEPEASEENSAPAAAAEASGANGAAATSSAAKPVPAGPAAMKVARRFSEAFVFYEIGKRPARAKIVFGETATPRLAEALSERTPRLPSSGKVPKARVLNLIPGPRRGKAYTVSASLLRVGLTSELRLEMKKKGGDWVVTDVRG